VGADIAALEVLDRSSGRATDDVTVECGGSLVEATSRIRERLAVEPGIRVVGLWPTTRTDAHGDTELIGQLARHPGSGPTILVETLPQLLDADWVALLDTRRDPVAVLLASAGVPTPLRLPPLTPVRLRMAQAPDGTRCAMAPFGRGGTVICAARRSAPAFHLTELERLAALTDAAAAVLGSAAVRQLPAPQAV
jgi:hypothetical protein